MDASIYWLASAHAATHTDYVSWSLKAEKHFAKTGFALVHPPHLLSTAFCRLVDLSETFSTRKEEYHGPSSPFSHTSRAERCTQSVTDKGTYAASRSTPGPDTEGHIGTDAGFGPDTVDRFGSQSMYNCPRKTYTV